MDLFEEFISIAESKLETKGVWKEEPVDLMTSSPHLIFLMKTLSRKTNRTGRNSKQYRTI